MPGSFAEYLTAELDPSAGARQPSAAELVRGQNERQRVCVAGPHISLCLASVLAMSEEMATTTNALRTDGCLLCRYNALLSVPYQLEQFLLFGLLICLDSFLVRLACLLPTSLLWKSLHEQPHASSTCAACSLAPVHRAPLLLH